MCYLNQRASKVVRPSSIAVRPSCKLTALSPLTNPTQSIHSMYSCVRPFPLLEPTRVSGVSANQPTSEVGAERPGGLPHPITPLNDREAFVCLLTLFPSSLSSLPFIPISQSLFSTDDDTSSNESVDTHAKFVAAVPLRGKFRDFSSLLNMRRMGDVVTTFPVDRPTIVLSSIVQGKRGDLEFRMALSLTSKHGEKTGSCNLTASKRFVPFKHRQPSTPNASGEGNMFIVDDDDDDKAHVCFALQTRSTDGRTRTEGRTLPAALLG